MGYGNAARSFFRFLFKQTVDGFAQGIFTGGVVECIEHLLLFFGGNDPDIDQPLRGVRDDVFNEVLKMPGQSLNGLQTKYAGIIFDKNINLVFLFNDGKGEIKLGGIIFEFQSTSGGFMFIASVFGNWCLVFSVWCLIGCRSLANTKY